jgi:hypothetical protein
MAAENISFFGIIACVLLYGEGYRVAAVITPGQQNSVPGYYANLMPDHTAGWTPEKVTDLLV